MECLDAVRKTPLDPLLESEQGGGTGGGDTVEEQVTANWNDHDVDFQRRGPDGWHNPLIEYSGEVAHAQTNGFRIDVVGELEHIAPEAGVPLVDVEHLVLRQGGRHRIGPPAAVLRTADYVGLVKQGPHPASGRRVVLDALHRAYRLKNRDEPLVDCHSARVAGGEE